MRHEGRCHCGALTVAFQSDTAPDAIPLRACGCTFCRRHGATWTSDPAGHLEFRADPAELLSRYRFGLGTSEFLVCRRCGVLLGASCTIDGHTFAALNANVLVDRDALTQTPLPVDYDAETATDRVERRLRAWTPAAVR